MPCFVILRHEMPQGHPRRLHWDFMLERGGTLATWSLAREPAVDDAQQADRLADHRLAYLSYEGPVSADRGHVERWDEGTYRPIEWSDERIVVLLAGGRLAGQVELAPLGDDRYRFIWRGVN